jgi:hypothetical protein
VRAIESFETSHGLQDWAFTRNCSQSTAERRRCRDDRLPETIDASRRSSCGHSEEWTAAAVPWFTFPIGGNVYAQNRDDATPDFYALFFLALALGWEFLLAYDNVFTHECESYSNINSSKPVARANLSGPNNARALQVDIPFIPGLRPGAGWIAGALIAQFLGALTVPLFNLLVAEAFDRRTAWSAAVLFACYPSHLRSSPTGWRKHLPVFLPAGCSASGWRLKHAGAKSWFLLSLGALGIAARRSAFRAWLFLPGRGLLMLKAAGPWRCCSAPFGDFPLRHMAWLPSSPAANAGTTNAGADAAGPAPCTCKAAVPRMAGECFLNGGRMRFQPQRPIKRAATADRGKLFP